jgi:hypothetical protein
VTEMKRIKKGNHLVNVKDVHGILHEKAVITEIYKSTVVILDCNTKTKWIVHKKTIGVKPDKQPNWLKSKNHFDLEASQKRGSMPHFDEANQSVFKKRVYY